MPATTLAATTLAATTLADRAVLRLAGDDVRGFLQGLVTSDVTGPLPLWAGLLSAQGKALFDFLVWADGGAPDGDLLIDCEAAQAAALARRLTLYRLRRAIAITRDETLAAHWSAEGADGVADPRLAALGRRWIAAPAPGDAGAAWRTHRLGLGVVEGVGELGAEKTLWLEANAAELGGVSFTKGCYVGQENTARMNWRQKVNRRLVVARVDGDPGEAARAWYPELGLAVALVRVEALRAPLVLGGIAAEVVMPAWLRAAVDGSDGAGAS